MQEIESLDVLAIAMEPEPFASWQMLELLEIGKVRLPLRQRRYVARFV